MLKNERRKRKGRINRIGQILRGERSDISQINLNDLVESNKSLQAKIDSLEHDLEVTKGLLDAAEDSKSNLIEQLKRIQDIVGEPA